MKDLELFDNIKVEKSSEHFSNYVIRYPNKAASQPLTTSEILQVAIIQRLDLILNKR